MAFPDIDGIAQAVAATLNAAGVTLDGNALKVYGREPREFDSLPAVAIRFSQFTRRGLDQAEIGLGQQAWILNYTVTIAVPLDDPDQGQTAIQDVVGAVIDAVDAGATFGRTDLEDAVLEDGEVEFTDDEGQRQMALCVCQLSVLAVTT